MEQKDRECLVLGQLMRTVIEKNQRFGLGNDLPKVHASLNELVSIREPRQSRARAGVRPESRVISR
jgi:hypothetical protein